MTTYYHVCDKYDGGALLTMRDQHDKESEAIRAFQENWPECGDLCFDHINMVHLHDNRQDALDFVQNYGGTILIIDGRELDIEVDTLEYPHPVCHHSIPADRISLYL